MDNQLTESLLKFIEAAGTFAHWVNTTSSENRDLKIKVADSECNKESLGHHGVFIPPVAKCIEAGWDILVEALYLDLMTAKEKDELKDAFIEAIQTHCPDKQHIFVENFIIRLARENGGGFARLKEDNPDIKQRINILREHIKCERTGKYGKII